MVYNMIDHESLVFFLIRKFVEIKNVMLIEIWAVQIFKFFKLYRILGDPKFVRIKKNLYRKRKPSDHGVQYY